MKTTHLSNECDKIHYIPDKDFLIKKLNFSKLQQRVKKTFPDKSKKQFNALSNLLIIRSHALKMNKNEEDEFPGSDASLSESNESLKNLNFARSKEKKGTKISYPDVSQKKNSIFFRMEEYNNTPKNNKNVLIPTIEEFSFSKTAKEFIKDINIEAVLFF